MEQKGEMGVRRAHSPKLKINCIYNCLEAFDNILYFKSYYKLNEHPVYYESFNINTNIYTANWHNSYIKNRRILDQNFHVRKSLLVIKH